MIILPIRKIINSFFAFFVISFKKYNLRHFLTGNISAPSHALSIIHPLGKCYKLYLCIFLRNSYGIPSFSENCTYIHTIQGIFPGYPNPPGACGLIRAQARLISAPGKETVFTVRSRHKQRTCPSPGSGRSTPSPWEPAQRGPRASNPRAS